MKKTILAFAIMTFSLSSIAGNGDKGDQYCAENRNGKIVVVYKGNIITTDVTLIDGTIIKTNGVVMMKDGSKMVLNDGQCINKDGSTTVDYTKPPGAK